MDKKMKIIALIALLVYVISPVDLAPGPMDDMVMCLLFGRQIHLRASTRCAWRLIAQKSGSHGMNAMGSVSYRIQEILVIPVSVTIV